MTGRALSAPAPDTALAARLFDELAARTTDPSGEGITRAAYGEGEAIAHDILRREALALGMQVRTDAAANLYATLRGERSGPAVFVGSHLDSVPKGGNFDGAAGVLMGLSVAAGFVRAGRRPPLDLIVMAIRAEESTWFPASYIGSRAAFGRLAADELSSLRRAGDGVALGQAIDAAGGDAQALAAGAAGLSPEAIALFIEPHIEQGPVLLEAGASLGFATGIRGSFRYRNAVCHGEYAHSGATPRAYRRDCVRAFALLVHAMEAAWTRRERSGEDLTVTFGQVTTDAAEAAFSKIAGKVSFSIDVRSADSGTLEAVEADLALAIAEIEASQGVRFDLGPRTASKPARMAPEVVFSLGEAARHAGVAPREMACGAGHDAAVFAQMGVPTGMILLRNANGSHNPSEAMTMEDFAAGAAVLAALVANRPDPHR